METEKERRDVSKRFVRQNVLDSKTTNSTLEERERAAAINRGCVKVIGVQESVFQGESFTSQEMKVLSLFVCRTDLD